MRRGQNNDNYDLDQPVFILSTQMPETGYPENNKNTYSNIFKMPCCSSHFFIAFGNQKYVQITKVLVRIL